MTQTVVSIFVVLLLMVVGWRLPSTKGRQIFLLAASYLFYANWGIGFLSILIISSLMNYTCGWALRRKADRAAVVDRYRTKPSASSFF